MAKKYQDISGQKWGNLLVLNQVEKLQRGTFYLCLCDCGNKTKATISQLLFGKKKSCGCLIKKKHRDKNRKNVILRRLFKNKITNARAVHSCELDNLELFEFIITSPCFYCGVQPNVTTKDVNKYGVVLSDEFIVHHGIDRIDPKIGYCIKNIVPCCKECNFSKGPMTSEEFIKKFIEISKFTGYLSSDNRNL